MSIIVVILVADDLSEDGVLALAMVGGGLALGLLKWNDATIESRLLRPRPRS